MSTLTRTLLTDWTLKAGSETPVNIPLAGVPATVPGCVHTDLMAAGLLDDPYLDDNDLHQLWVGTTDWTYQTHLDHIPTTSPADRVELVFEGLDTVAQVLLNGRELGRVQNMHRTHRFDITDMQVEGSNALTVNFSAPTPAANAASLAVGPRPHTESHPHNALRKMACSFGWDWGPDTASSGMWRPAAVESWSVGRLSQVRPLATLATGGESSADDGSDTGTVTVAVEVQTTGRTPLTVRVTLSGPGIGDLTHEAPVIDGTATVTMTAEGVQRWWPVGHGDQPRYDVTTTLLDGQTVLDETTKRVGFRTVEWRTAPDDIGMPFTLVVNDQVIVVKGVNWIPDDCFPHRVTRDRYRRRFEQALFAGCNLIRVWGGGVYESDDFYDLADEFGLLTWQDFLLACAFYTDDDPLRGEITAEARDNVARVAHHASLVLFNGCNENIWASKDWGWTEFNEGRTWGAGYYWDVLPRVVAELAPGVHYTPGSPFSPDQTSEHEGSHPNTPEKGTMHIWDTWNSLPAIDYRHYRSRFVAEFGWQGPPAWATLTRACRETPLTPESPFVLHHQRASEGMGKLHRGIHANFVVPSEIEGWHWAGQLTQARSVELAIAWYRSLFPENTGTVVWQLNDCWPVSSWAAVDGDGRAKPLLYALKHVHADRLVTVQPVEPVTTHHLSPSDGSLDVVVLNDTGVSWTTTLIAERTRWDATPVASQTHEVSVDAHGVCRVRLGDDVVGTESGADEYLRVRVEGAADAWWWFTADRDSSLGAAVLDVSVAGDRVTLTAREVLAKDVALLVDKVDASAEVDDALVHVAAGESVTFIITSDLDWTEDDVRTALVTANDLLVTEGAHV